MVVYLVYTVYRYDGLDEIFVYSTKEKAIEAADKAVQNFLGNEYEFSDGYENFSSFLYAIASDYATVTLDNDDGEVRIEIEKKVVQ